MRCAACGRDVFDDGPCSSRVRNSGRLPRKCEEEIRENNQRTGPSASATAHLSATGRGGVRRMSTRTVGAQDRLRVRSSEDQWPAAGLDASCPERAASRAARCPAARQGAARWKAPGRLRSARTPPGRTRGRRARHSSRRSCRRWRAAPGSRCRSWRRRAR